MSIQDSARDLPNLAPDAIPLRWRRHPFLTRIEQFIDLSDKDRAALWRLMIPQPTVSKRSDLVVDGYEYRKLCFVEKGFAARYKLLRNGKRQVIDFVLPGDVIGLPASFVEKAGYSVIALTDLKLHVCSLHAYVGLCYRRPQFGLILSWLAVHEGITCAEHIINNGRRTPAERLAHLLLEMHARLTIVGLASEIAFDLPFSQEVMSDALGLSVPHLNRTLAKLRDDGFIAIKDRCVELLDRKGLELLGHFQPLNLAQVPQYSTGA